MAWWWSKTLISSLHLPSVCSAFCSLTSALPECNCVSASIFILSTGTVWWNRYLYLVFFFPCVFTEMVWLTSFPDRFCVVLSVIKSSDCSSIVWIIFVLCLSVEKRNCLTKPALEHLNEVLLFLCFFWGSYPCIKLSLEVASVLISYVKNSQYEAMTRRVYLTKNLNRGYTVSISVHHQVLFNSSGALPSLRTSLFLNWKVNLFCFLHTHQFCASFCIKVQQKG